MYLEPGIQIVSGTCPYTPTAATVAASRGGVTGLASSQRRGDIDCPDSQVRHGDSEVKELVQSHTARPGRKVNPLQLNSDQGEVYA